MAIASISRPAATGAPLPKRKRKKIAVFLGAGASSPLGIPITKAITTTILEKLESDDLYDFARYHAQLRRLLHKAYPQIRQKNSYIPDITELLSLLDHQVAQGRSLRPGLSLDEVVQLRRLLVIAICEVLYEPRAVPAKLKATMKPWLQWIRTLVKDPANAYDVAFITTNYDRIIDQILWDELGHEAIGEVDFGLEWHYADNDSPADEVPVPANPRVRSYKLHGSLDYVGCQRCQRVYISSEPNYYVPLLARAPETECHCRQHPLDSIVVVPTMARRTPFPRLNDIWRRAGMFMSEADAWVIAGYSMPTEDLFIKELLLTAFHTGATRARRRIDVVQYQPDNNGDRFALYFGEQGTMRSYYGGLQSYVSQPSTIFQDAVARRL